MKKKVYSLVAAGCLALGLSACNKSKADVVAHNLSKEAEQFQVQRRIVFFNGITDKYLLTIEGRCSVETGDSAISGSLEVTCQTGKNKFKKDFLGLSDNVSYMVEQVDPLNVSEYHYKVLFRPETLIPDIDKS